MNKNEQLSALRLRLKKIEERLVNPMASVETIHELSKTKNELEAEIQVLEIGLDKGKHPAKPFERLLNETHEL